MEYRLLGPLEIVAGDHNLQISSARQRTVLAMLLLQANKVVPVGQLVDAVWDDNPPATAKSQIHTCISGLRGQLASAGAARVIVTRPVGYAMTVPDGGLDIANFEQLARRGRAAAADNRAEEAVPDLRAALGLWRGPAGSDVESKLVQVAAVRLNERRLSVLEDCIELELGLGRHRDLAGELTELVARYPLRERLRAQHMLSLYRSARQAEALRSFREVRQIFIDELGLEPGEDLCALERAILESDPALELEPAARSGPRAPRPGTQAIPRQLPAAVADFTGREEVLSSISALLSPSGSEPDGTRFLPVVVLSGKGGVGKTAIALHAAHASRPHYPDGQIFVQLQEADGQLIGPLEVLTRLLRALGIAPAALPEGIAERTAVYRTALGDRRVLIVLDDAVDTGQVLPLIPGSPNCAVIMTSRNRLLGLPGARHFEIGDLDERTSVDLLARIIGPDRVQAEAASALALTRLCGCLPLALRIAGAKVAARPHWRIDQMVRRLTDEGRRLDELALSGIAIRTTLSLSYNSLSGDARRLFTRLGLLGTADFGSWVAAPLLDADAETATELLETLADARLLEVRVREDGSARFRLHDLIRIYALERLAEEPMAERSAALERILGCWLSLVGEAHRRRYGGDYVVLHGGAARWTLPPEVIEELLSDPLGWLRAERAGLVSAIVQAAQAGLDELCWDLAMTSVTLFEADYQVNDWRKTHQAALEVTRRAGNLRGEAAILCSLGSLAVGVRAGTAARYLDRALGIFDKLSDTHGRALTLGLLAFVDRLDGHYEEALARYEQALAGFREVGDLVGEVDMLTSMAQVEMARERFDVVEELLDRALAICQSTRAPRIIAQTEYRLGEFYLHTGDLERAERSFRSVLQAVSDDDLVGAAYALQGTGIVRTRRRQYALAEADLRAALRAARRVGDNLVLGRVLLAYTELYLAMDRPDSARSMIDEGLAVFVEIGPAPVWRARFLELRARLAEPASRPEDAGFRALELADEVNPVLAAGQLRRPLADWPLAL
jgi:DNA-binding SARP family transcriptional activator/tetratricopeptide (TPR) repeat protein